MRIGFLFCLFFSRHLLSMKSGSSLPRNTEHFQLNVQNMHKRKSSELRTDVGYFWQRALFSATHLLCFKEIHSAKRLWTRKVRISFSHHICSDKSSTGHHNTFIIIISNNSKFIHIWKTYIQQWIRITMKRIQKCATVPIAISSSLHWSCFLYGF